MRAVGEVGWGAGRERRGARERVGGTNRDTETDRHRDRPAGRQTVTEQQIAESR